jgi:glucokinase
MSGLIADIGGTNVRFARVGDEGAIEHIQVLRCADYPTLFEACQRYLASTSPTVQPRHAALAIASPVTGDDVRMTNHHWAFSIEETRRRLGLESLDVINDFIAVALGIPHLRAADVRRVGGGDADPHAKMVALGPGTGLGVAGLARTGLGGRIPLSSEGGHATLAAFNDREADVVAILRRRLGHVSAERVLSGPGLVNLYGAIAELHGVAADPDITPADCTERGIAKSCPICVETVAMFCEMLGTVAADVALTFDARGGVFIAGGIVPKLGDSFDASVFRARFEDKGRFRPYLAKIPVAVVIRTHPAFAGLAAIVSGQ